MAGINYYKDEPGFQIRLKGVQFLRQELPKKCPGVSVRNASRPDEHADVGLTFLTFT